MERATETIEIMKNQAITMLKKILIDQPIKLSIMESTSCQEAKLEPLEWAD